MEPVTVKNKSYQTAIKRTDLSKPIREIMTKTGAGVDLSWPKVVLDYGCGKGTDAKALGTDMYDPWYYPEIPTKQYDTILCTYVFNVIDGGDRLEAFFNILELLKPGGVAYITVRRDYKNWGKNSKQYRVEFGEIDYNKFKLKSFMHRKGQFETYQLFKKES